jgi:transcription antitermination factor NusG
VLNNTDKKWFILYTRPLSEKKVVDWLKKKRIEYYCPYGEVAYQLGNYRQLLSEPLFKSYVFVRVDEPEQLPFRFSDGVINFVYWLNKPASIQDKEIRLIKEFVDHHKNIKSEKIPARINDNIHVISESEMNQKGQVISIKNKTKKLIFPSLGYTLISELEEAITENNIPEKTSSANRQSFNYTAK